MGQLSTINVVKEKFFNFIYNIHRLYKLSIIMIKPSKFTMYWTLITPGSLTLSHITQIIIYVISKKMVQVVSISTSYHRDHIKISIYIKLICLWMSYNAQLHKARNYKAVIIKMHLCLLYMPAYVNILIWVFNGNLHNSV